MKFKTDENLPVDVDDLPRQHGHDSESVVDRQLARHPDTGIAMTCQAERRALVTLDLDFSDIRAYPPEDHHGIIVFRPAVQTVSAIVRLATRLISVLGTEPLAGRLWIVDEHQVRIRGWSLVIGHYSLVIGSLVTGSPRMTRANGHTKERRRATCGQHDVDRQLCAA